MATSARRREDLLVDTSVAVALTVADHEHHDETFDALQGRRLGLAGHAAFETFSVLTRLPAPARRTPATVARLLARSFPHSSSCPDRPRARPDPTQRPCSTARCRSACVPALANRSV